MLKKVFLLALFLFLAESSLAADSSIGCGLGYQVAPKNTLISTTSRATTNALFSNQLFGITSGTSGCARHPIVKKNPKAFYFAYNNMQNLKVEVAQGGGEFLNAFASTLGCQNYKSFASTMQGQYKKLFHKETTVVGLIESVNETLEKNPSSCHSVSEV